MNHSLNHFLRWIGAIALVVVIAGCTTPAAQSTNNWQGSSFDEASDRPPTARTLRVMSQILISQGKMPQAEYVLLRLIQDYPGDASAYSDLAALQMNDNRVHEAIDTLSKALEYEPRDPGTLNNLGMCYMRLGEPEMAVSRFRAASQQRPGEARYVANEAVALGWLGMYDQSFTAFCSILSPAEAHYNVAVLCESREDYERAAEEYTLAHELDSRIEIEEHLTRIGHKLAALEGTGVETASIPTVK